MSTWDGPTLFVHQLNKLPEDRRLGLWLKDRGVDVEWCSIGTLRSGRYPMGYSTLVSGAVGFVRAALELAGVVVPPALGFPDELAPWLHREVRRTTLDQALIGCSGSKLFIKPADQLKLFTGSLTDDPELLDTLQALDPATSVWVSEPIKFLAEWRCFVIDGELRAIAQYRPDFDVVLWPEPKEEELEDLIATAHGVTGLAGFSVDVGRLPTGEIALVELNDGYALGSYGIPDELYFELIWARWRQMFASPHTTRS